MLPQNTRTSGLPAYELSETLLPPSVVPPKSGALGSGSSVVVVEDWLVDGGRALVVVDELGGVVLDDDVAPDEGVTAEAGVVLKTGLEPTVVGPPATVDTEEEAVVDDRMAPEPGDWAVVTADDDAVTVPGPSSDEQAPEIRPAATKTKTTAKPRPVPGLLGARWAHHAPPVGFLMNPDIGHSRT